MHVQAVLKGGISLCIPIIQSRRGGNETYPRQFQTACRRAIGGHQSICTRLRIDFLEQITQYLLAIAMTEQEEKFSLTDNN